MNKWKKRIIIQKWLTELTVLAQTTSLANLIHKDNFFYLILEDNFFASYSRQYFYLVLPKTIFLPHTQDNFFYLILPRQFFLPHTPKTIFIHCSTCSGPDYSWKSAHFTLCNQSINREPRQIFVNYNNEKTQYFIAVILFYWKPFEIRTINVEIINLHWSTVDLHIYNISQKIHVQIFGFCQDYCTKYTASISLNFKCNIK